MNELIKKTRAFERVCLFVVENIFYELTFSYLHLNSARLLFHKYYMLDMHIFL